MDHPADITFINTHTEGNRCTDNIYPVMNKVILCLFPLLGRQSRVIGGCLDLEQRQFFGQHFCVTSFHAIDDSALVTMLADKMDDRFDLLFLVESAADCKRQIWPVERGNKDLGIIQPELFDDVRAGHFIGCRSQGNDRNLGKAFLQNR